MYITVVFPVPHPAGDRCFIDPADNWTVQDLCDYLQYTARIEGYKLQCDGVDLPTTTLAYEILKANDIVTLVKE